MNDFYFNKMSDEQTKTLINSEQSYRAFLDAIRKYNESYRFSYSSQNDKRFYKYDPNNGKKSYLKITKPEFEEIKLSYERSKTDAKNRLSLMYDNIKAREKYNKFERINNAPSILVDIFSKINEYELDKKLIVVGTNSLYVYENLFGVKFIDRYLATEDIDLFNKRGAKIKLALFDQKEIRHFGDFLKKVDSSFNRNDKLPYAYVNKDNAVVEIINPYSSNIVIRSEKIDPFFDEAVDKISINGSSWIDSARTVSSVVVDVRGKMADVTAIHPLEFAIYKHWLSKQPDRNFKKIARDEQTSRAVLALLNELYPRSVVEEAKGILHIKKSVVADFIHNNFITTEMIVDENFYDSLKSISKENNTLAKK